MARFDDEATRRFFTAVFQAHLADWSVQQVLKALDGYGMRDHVETAHPDQVAVVREMMPQRLETEGDRQAWLFGYDFRDTDAGKQAD